MSLYIRDIKLDLLMGNQNPIVDLFYEITTGIKIINCNTYNEDGLEFIYHKDGEWIFYQDSQNGDFWCNESNYWSLFRDKFDLEYGDIQSITKYLIEEALKLDVSTTNKKKTSAYTEIEEALKLDVSTTFACDGLNQILVEEALKIEVSSTDSLLVENANGIEDALKKGLNDTHSIESVCLSFSNTP